MASGLLKDYVGRGLLAARPATPTPATGVGALYFGTDTGILYSWNGSAWIAPAGGGSSAPWWFVPTTAASFTSTVYNSAGGTPAPTLVDDTDLGTVATFQNLTGGGTMAGFFKARTFLADWQLDARISALTNPGNYAGAGLCIRDSATGRCFTYGAFSDVSGSSPTAVALTQWTFDSVGSSYNSHVVKEYGHLSSANDLWLRLKFVFATGNIIPMISADGKNFHSIFGAGSNVAAWAANANQIGFYHQNQFQSTNDGNQYVSCGRWVMVG